MKFWFVFGIIYGVACWIANIVLCYRLAESKNRNSTSWALFAFFFGILATLWLACEKGFTAEEKTAMQKAKKEAYLYELKTRLDTNLLDLKKTTDPGAIKYLQSEIEHCEREIKDTEKLIEKLKQPGYRERP